MNGYSWVPITALLCYLFLFLTSFSSKKENKEIKSFMVLMVIMMCWTGGSFAMRTQFWPSVNFWHHVSCLGIYLIAPGYYMFLIDFLEKKTPSRKTFLWVAVTVFMFV
ncbi:MAG: diguanylate cyclase, partial [Firmicutes bacterium]|nr:diguanylate cyclase [Bacillota bacterium]